MTANQAKISIKVIPNAGKNEVVDFSNGVWRIKVGAPPDKGKANKELIAFLSKTLELRKDNIEILIGQKSHHKVVGITGLSLDKITTKLSGE
jgi:uncharacterized protein (TIGR00251 family)